MFSFIDSEIIGATIFLFISFSLLVFSFYAGKKKRAISKKAKIMILLIPLIPFFNGWINHHTALINIELFHKNIPLECRLNNNNYLISKDSGWSVDRYSFLNNSLLIRAFKCEKR